MSLGILVSLPSHVELFDPVVRRLGGARFVLAAGRWPSPHLDSRRWTRRALARRGWVAEENPSADLDLLLCGNHLSPEAATGWLRPGGRVALWRAETRPGRLLRVASGLTNTLRPIDPVALVCAPSPAFARGVKGCPVTVTGDPRLDSFGEVGAASRASTQLGMKGSGPVVLIVAERPDGPVRRWAHALASLRSDAQLILWAHDRCWLREAYPFGRPLTGPGLHLVDPQNPVAFADLLATADLVLAEQGRSAAMARRAGKPALILQEDPGRARSRVKAFPDPLCEILRDTPRVEDPALLREAMNEVLHAPAPIPCPSVMEGKAAVQLAQAIESAATWLVPDYAADNSA